MVCDSLECGVQQAMVDLELHIEATLVGLKSKLEVAVHPPAEAVVLALCEAAKRL